MTADDLTQREADVFRLAVDAGGTLRAADLGIDEMWTAEQLVRSGVLGRDGKAYRLTGTGWALAEQMPA